MPQPLLSAERLQARIDELAVEVDQDFRDRDLLVVCILKGSYIFTADLTRRLTIPHEVDFMAVTSYGTGTTSSGNVQITQDLHHDVEGRDLLLVEDIIDTGTTLRFLIETLGDRGAGSISIMTLLRKEGVEVGELPEVHYVGFTVPPVFVVGYGLDYAERYRHLPFVGTLVLPIPDGE